MIRAYDPEVMVTRKVVELPPDFVCAVCDRTIKAEIWSVHQGRHRPPVCFSCSNIEGHQARIPHMTRGDHHTLQRLVAVTNALLRTATWRGRGWH